MGPPHFAPQAVYWTETGLFLMPLRDHTLRPDVPPLSQLHLPASTNSLAENSPKYEVSSIAELPGATPQPWSDPRPGVPAGELHKHRVESVVLGNQRSVAVYTPPGYRKEEKGYPWLLLFDEATYQSQVPAPVILDNLIAERRIAPMVAVLLNYPTQDARERELFANPRFADFVSQELVPWVSREYHISTDSTKNVVGGLSAGGFAAACLAVHHSEIFGNVISQSGAFWWAPKRDEGEEPKWLAREYASSARQPVKFYLEAGMFENDIKGSGRPNPGDQPTST